MYLNQFPKTTYNFKGTPFESMEVLDIMRRVAFRFKPYTLTIRPTEPYIPSQGDTVDTIAEQYYGDAEYWWLVCLFNDIINPFNALPRNERDYTYLKGARHTKRLYIEREGGHPWRDFQRGDIIIACHQSSVIEEYTLPGGTVYENVPLPLTDDNSIPKAVARIETWDKTLRQAKLEGPGAEYFYNLNNTGGSEMKVVAFAPSEFNYRDTFDWKVPHFNDVANWGKVDTVHEQPDMIVGFREKHTGNIKHPMTDYTTGEIKEGYVGTRYQVPGSGTDNPDDDGGAGRFVPTMVWDYENTLIGGYLGVPHETTSTWNSRYEEITREQQMQEFRTNGVNDIEQDNYIKPKLRLLIPQYATEAYTLFKRALNDERFSIHEFTNMMSDVRDTPVIYL